MTTNANGHVPATQQTDLTRWFGADFYTPAPAANVGLVATLTGQQRSGKTHFILTTPDEVVVLFRFEPVEKDAELFDRFRAAGKTLVLKDVPQFYGKPDAAAKQIWATYRGEFLHALSYPYPCTVAVDGHGFEYDLGQIAVTGSIRGKNRIQRFDHGNLYNDYRELIDAAYASRKHVFWTRRVRDEFVGENRTGGVKPRGWADLGYEVGLDLWCAKNTRDVLDPQTNAVLRVEHFCGAMIRDCAADIEANGEWFIGADMTIEKVAERVHRRDRALQTGTEVTA